MTPPCTKGCYIHFAKRVAERIGPQISAKELWEGLIWAIQKERWDIVQFVGRLNRTGRRLFKFRVPDGRFFFVIYDHNLDCPVTVLPPEGDRSAA